MLPIASTTESNCMTDPEREHRIRFENLDLAQLPDSRCRGEVVLSWSADDRVTGTAEGVSSSRGLLRCAAEATAQALATLVDRQVAIELQGVTTIKAFDATIVVVSLLNRSGDHEHRVVGTSVASGDAPQAAVRAVLNATNRLLGDLIYVR
jgi:hypothetical protein